MNAESVAYNFLSNDDDIEALVDGRIYPDFIPQAQDLPAIAITRSDTEYTSTIHVGRPVAIQVTMAIWCLALTRVAAEELADMVIETLTGSPGGFLPIGREPESDAGPPAQHAVILSLTYWEM